MENPLAQGKLVSETEATGCLPLLLRLTWMVFGNLALFLCAAFIIKKSAPVLADIAYFSVAAGLILVRYLDIAKYNGLTSDEKPATLADWRRYAILLSFIAVGIWVLARFLATLGWL